MNLHSIIEAATPGPWVLEKTTDTVCEVGREAVYCACASPDDAADARHIATFDPTLTAAMLAVCEAVSGLVRDGLVQSSGNWERLGEALGALDTLLTERGLTMGGDDE